MNDSQDKSELVPLWDDVELPKIMVRPWVKRLVEEAQKGLSKRLGITSKNNEAEVVGKVLSLWESVAHNSEQNPVETYLVSHPHSKELVEKSKKSMEQLKESMPEAQAEIMKVPYTEKQDFFQGYNSVRKVTELDPTGTPHWATDAAPIYAIMFTHWQIIDQMESVTQLHEFLLAGFPELQRKRVEGICQRIGLKFRGRGQPRKEKKT